MFCVAWRTVNNINQSKFISCNWIFCWILTYVSCCLRVLVLLTFISSSSAFAVSLGILQNFAPSAEFSPSCSMLNCSFHGLLLRFRPAVRPHFRFFCNFNSVKLISDFFYQCFYPRILNKFSRAQISFPTVEYSKSRWKLLKENGLVQWKKWESINYRRLKIYIAYLER